MHLALIFHEDFRAELRGQDVQLRFNRRRRGSEMAELRALNKGFYYWLQRTSHGDLQGSCNNTGSEG